MRCLTDAELQSAIDHEATDAIVSHLASCARCRSRADARRADTATLIAGVNDVELPAEARARIRTAIASIDTVRGGTTMRPASTSPLHWHRPAVISALATAAGVALVLYLVLPRFVAPTTLSASEILGRSLQTLSAARGIELLEYELTIGKGGPHRIRQLVDYDHPARFRLTNIGADGILQSAISQDPDTGRRSHLVRIDGRNYVFELTSSAGAPFIPIPQIAQAQVEAIITMMQTTSDQKLTIADGPGGKEYVVQLPPVAPASGAGMLELYQARAVIGAADFRVRQFEAAGAILKQPWTVSFKLLRRTTLNPAEISADDFRLPAGPDDVVLKGDATADIFADVVSTALRELAKQRSTP